MVLLVCCPPQNVHANVGSVIASHLVCNGDCHHEFAKLLCLLQLVFGGFVIQSAFEILCRPSFTYHRVLEDEGLFLEHWMLESTF